MALRGEPLPSDRQIWYADPQLTRNEHYRGRDWDEEQARLVLCDLLNYFAGDFPLPPIGLPGRNDSVYPDAYNLLRAGRDYFAACAEGRPGRQWSHYNEVAEALRQAYWRGTEDERERVMAAQIANAMPGPGPKADRALVYFIGTESGPIKIGKANDPGNRLKSLQTSHHEKLSILATTDGGHDREQAYHKRFAEHRLHGEWFTRTPEIEAEIARLTAKDLAA